VTDLVDALESDGLVARRPHPTDRRATLVGLTRRGKAEVARMQAGYEALAAALFGDLPSTDVAALAVAINQLGARLRQRLSS
jgi:DNA-binding MarR family transcriptional regulator